MVSKAKKVARARKPARATKRRGSVARRGKQAGVALGVDLSNPKEKAVLDVLALAMSADEVVTASEMKLAVSHLQSLLKLPASNALLNRELTDLLNASVLSIQAKGRDVVMDRALLRIESDEERRMLFALATSVTCADGTVEPSEARFLSVLRRGLGLSEAEALQGAVGVASVMARRGVA